MRIPKACVAPLARAGYAARGLIYLVIGFFGILAAMGSGDNKDSKGALLSLLSQPSGDVIVSVLIAGLAGYVMWRLIQSVFDTDDHGWSARGLAVRIGLLASAAIYFTLALYAASLTGWFAGGGSGSGGGLAGFLSGFVGTRWVAWIIAAIFLIAGFAHYWKAGTEKFAEHFVAGPAVMRVVTPVSVIGLVARGTVFLVLGLLLALRGMTASGDGSAPNIKDAMEFMQSLPFGSILLGAMSLGIILFALYSFCEAIWRRINVEDADAPGTLAGSSSARWA